VPPLLYALFGTSSTQSVGPMAIISLMTASALAPLAAPGGSLYVILAAQLAALAGAVLLACGLLRIGFLANFFSRPVMNGFTIGSSDRDRTRPVRHLLGAPFPYWHGPARCSAWARSPSCWRRGAGWRPCCSGSAWRRARPASARAWRRCCWC
jgi:SulP family sulfate permease